MQAFLKPVPLIPRNFIPISIISSFSIPSKLIPLKTSPFAQRYGTMAANAPQKKRIIICCDGTWNDSDGTLQPPTNVTKLCRSVKPETIVDGKPLTQTVFYQSGIGTKSPTKIDHTFDGAFGRGISENVRQAYGYLCNNYNPGDEIFLVGFSRGAFTARVISSLINDIGVLTRRGLGYFYDIFTAWEMKNHDDKVSESTSLRSEFLSLSSVFKKKKMPFSELQEQLSKTAFTNYNIPVQCCAVWDTVGSLGIPIDGVTNPFSFVNTEISPNVIHGIHALALDEHREHFTPTIWEIPESNTTLKSLKQCWFTGCHTHIGGGNENNNEMPNIALAWMLSQLSPYIAFDYEPVNKHKEDLDLATRLELIGEAAPDSKEMIDSQTILYKLFDGSITRTPHQYCRVDPLTMTPTDKRLTRTNETVHSSVRKRFWGKKFVGTAEHAYCSLALSEWDYKTDPTPRWVHKTKLNKEGTPLTLLEEKIDSVEESILQKWSWDGKDISDFNLFEATH